MAKQLTSILTDESIRRLYEIVRFDLPLGRFDARQNNSLIGLIPELEQRVRDYIIPEGPLETEKELDAGRLLLRILFHCNEYYSMTDRVISSAQSRMSAMEPFPDSISQRLSVDRILPLFEPLREQRGHPYGNENLASLNIYRQRYARALILYYLSSLAVEYERSIYKIKDLKSLHNSIQALSDLLKTTLDKRLHNNLGLLAALHFTSGRIEAAIGEFAAGAQNFIEAISLYEQMARAYIEIEFSPEGSAEDRRIRTVDRESSPRRRQANIIRQRTAWSCYRLARCYYEMGETSEAESTIKHALFLITPEENKRGKALFLCQALTIERSLVTANKDDLRSVTTRLISSYKACRPLLPVDYRIITAVEIGYAKTYLGEYDEAESVVRPLLRLTEEDKVLNMLKKTTPADDLLPPEDGWVPHNPQMSFRILALATVLFSHRALYGGLDEKEKQNFSRASFIAAKRGYEVVKAVDGLAIDSLTLLAQAKLCLAACEARKKEEHLAEAGKYLEQAETKMKSIEFIRAGESNFQDITRTALILIIRIELAKAYEDRVALDKNIRRFQKIEKKVKDGFIKVLWDRAVEGLDLEIYDFILHDGSSLDIKEMEILLRAWYIEQKERGLAGGGKGREQEREVKKEELAKAANYSRSTIFEIQRQAEEIRKKQK